MPPARAFTWPSHSYNIYHISNARYSKFVHYACLKFRRWPHVLLIKTLNLWIHAESQQWPSTSYNSCRTTHSITRQFPSLLFASQYTQIQDSADIAVYGYIPVQNACRMESLMSLWLHCPLYSIASLNPINSAEIKSLLLLLLLVILTSDQFPPNDLSPAPRHLHLMLFHASLHAVFMHLMN